MSKSNFDAFVSLLLSRNGVSFSGILLAVLLGREFTIQFNGWTSSNVFRCRIRGKPTGNYSLQM